MTSLDVRLCQAAAKYLLYSLNELQTSPQTHCTISDELMSIMADLNLTQQSILIQRAHRYLAVNVNLAALEKQVSEISMLRDEKDLEDYYLLLGAPLKLMRRLFGMHASEFSRRRKLLNIKGVGSGRPPVCSEKTEHQVWRLWEKYSGEDERRRFQIIAETAGLDLHVIWSSLREHIES